MVPMKMMNALLMFLILSTTESDSLVCLMSFQASVCCKKKCNTQKIFIYVDCNDAGCISILGALFVYGCSDSEV